MVSILEKNHKMSFHTPTKLIKASSREASDNVRRRCGRSNKKALKTHRELRKKTFVVLIIMPIKPRHPMGRKSYNLILLTTSRYIYHVLSFLINIIKGIVSPWKNFSYVRSGCLVNSKTVLKILNNIFLTLKISFG